MKTSIYSQHQEHAEWMNKLAFYKDEIVVMQKRIDEVSAKNTSHDLSIKLTHFQNQLTIQSNNIRDLSHHINREEQKIQNNIESNPVAADHRKLEDHAEDRDKVLSFESNFNHLRKELNELLSKWM
ncbi:MAG: hypothetical protein IT236_15035 [Bacteroidia bacterium]|nr:hypothetical protein [Bacteroidia bacterium]